MIKELKKFQEAQLIHVVAKSEEEARLKIFSQNLFEESSVILTFVAEYYSIPEEVLLHWYVFNVQIIEK